MSKPIVFSGLNHYPKGNASISLDGETLVVKDLENSLDGITIETQGADEWEATLKPITLTPDMVVGATFNLVDNLQRVKTVGQWSVVYSPDGKYAYLVVNSKLEGKDIEVLAMKDGKEVFRRVYTKPEDPTCNWIIVAIFVLAAASVVLSNIDYKKTTTTVNDGQGHITTTTTTTKSFGGGGVVQPVSKMAGSGSGTEMEDQQISVDHLYITSSFCYPGGLPEELDGKIHEVVIAAKGTDLQFEREEYARS